MTIFAGFEPNSAEQAIHRVAVLAYDGVVLGDLALPRRSLGGCAMQKGNLNLQVPWRLSSVAR
jgi:hypothetical protein